MMAGAEEPATLSGLCQPMAIAMVTGGRVVNPECRRAGGDRIGDRGSKTISRALPTTTETDVEGSGRAFGDRFRWWVILGLCCVEQQRKWRTKGEG